HDRAHDGRSPRSQRPHACVPWPAKENVKTAFLQAPWFVARSSIATNGVVAPCAGSATDPCAATTTDTEPPAVFDCVTCRFVGPSQPGSELPGSTVTESAVTVRSKSNGFETVSGRGPPPPGERRPGALPEIANNPDGSGGLSEPNTVQVKHVSGPTTPPGPRARTQ